MLRRSTLGIEIAGISHVRIEPKRKSLTPSVTRSEEGISTRLALD